MGDGIESLGGGGQIILGSIEDLPQAEALAVVAWTNAEVPRRFYDGLVKRVAKVDLYERRSQKVFDKYREEFSKGLTDSVIEKPQPVDGTGM